jgi:predicted DNA-binding transcriptional regulator AlpA
VFHQKEIFAGECRKSDIEGHELCVRAPQWLSGDIRGDSQMANDNHVPSVPQLLTASEAATHLRISKRSWWRLVSAGKAPEPVRLGGAVLWRQAELAAWIAAGCPTVRHEKAGEEGAR